MYEVSMPWSARLVLGALLLAGRAGASEPAPKEAPAREATYRVGPAAGCVPCVLEEQVKKQGAPGARDCGTLLLGERGPGVLDCVRESLEARVPFRVRHQLGDAQSVHEEALVSDGRQAWWLSFDVSGPEGSECTARVVRRGCASLVQDGTGLWPRCEQPGRSEVLCDQLRHVEPEPPQPVSRLTCTAATRSKSEWYCDVHPPGTAPGPRTPRRDGPNLRCEALRSGRLFCRAGN